MLTEQYLSRTRKFDFSWLLFLNFVCICRFSCGRQLDASAEQLRDQASVNIICSFLHKLEQFHPWEKFAMLMNKRIEICQAVGLISLQNKSNSIAEPSWVQSSITNAGARTQDCTPGRNLFALVRILWKVCLHRYYSDQHQSIIYS